MTETTILDQVQYWHRNPNWPILSADTVTNTKTTFQRKNLVTNTRSMYYVVWGIFSIIKGPLEQNFWSFGFGKKRYALTPILKLDLGYGCTLKASHQTSLLQWGYFMLWVASWTFKQLRLQKIFSRGSGLELFPKPRNGLMKYL